MAKRKWLARLVGVLIFGMLAGDMRAETAKVAGDCWVYLGSFGDAKRGGIYLFRMDGAGGKLAAVGEGQAGAKGEAVGFFAVHPSGKFLYAVTDAVVGKVAGAVEAFAVDGATGKLTFLNRVESAAREPVCLAVDSTGKFLVVVDYSGASVALFPIGEDGKVGAALDVVKHAGKGVDALRQMQAYPHGVVFDAKGERVFVADLGMDQVVEYRVDREKGKLIALAKASVKAGDGARHLALGKDEKYLYVAGEMANTVTVFAIDEKGAMKEVERVMPWEDAVKGPDTAAEIAVDARGKFLYVSERGLDSLAVFAIDAETGKLTLLQKVSCGGKVPRSFGIAPGGRFLVVENQGSDSVCMFEIAEGKLKAIGDGVTVSKPVCVGFVPVK